MKKVLIKAAYVSGYKNAQHAAYMQFFKTAVIVRYPEIAQRFPELTSAFVKAFSHEDDVFLKPDRTLFNKDLTKQDAERAIKFRILRDSAKIFLLNSDPQKVSAAEIVMEVFKLYGGTGIIGQGMSMENGLLTNLVDDLAGPYAEQISLLGLTEQLADLKAANDQYIETLADRTQYDADYGKLAVVAARKSTDTAYHNLVNVVNATNDTEPSAELNEFSSYVNAEIDRYRISLGLGVGANTGSGSVDGDGTPLKKYATFKFISGSQQKFLVEVGAPLVAPENTPGYVWKPKVPELMPSTNKNFSEVAIDPVKFTATFHFHNHREEEIKQVAGSELTAPENTQGYVWDPTVPATMPAEDTTYYEIAAEEEETEQQPGEGEQQPGTGTEQKPGEGTEQQPTLYKITYMHKGQVYAVQEYEVGARITTIDPPEGYYWRETTPGIMPAHDITITSTDDPYGIL